MDNKVLEAFKNSLSLNIAQCPDEALLELAHAVWYKGCQISERDLESLVAETDTETLKRNALHSGVDHHVSCLPSRHNKNAAARHRKNALGHY